VDSHINATFDFTLLTPTVKVTACWIKVRPGGEPQLVIGPPLVGMNAGTPTSIVTANVVGGIAGRAYDVYINIRGDVGGVYTFHWVVNIDGDDCGCTSVVSPYNGAGSVVSGDGSVIVNDRPRFFVSATFPVNPQVLDRWYDPTSTNIYDYVSNGLTTYWELAGASTGGGGGGGSGGSGANIVTIQPIFPDGVTTNFMLVATSGPVAVTAANTLFVSVDGVWQEAVVQYQAVDNQIQFIQPPSADSHIFIQWFTPPGSV
jgi:hypothetical protein